MTKMEILLELQRIGSELEKVASECDVNLKGYSYGAVQVAIEAVGHACDLVSVSSEE